jgi:hypothetical protein
MSAERKTLTGGAPNPKYVDLLDEDPAIAGQKFACVSFLSPEAVIKQREQFVFSEFAKQWDGAKSMSIFGEFLNFVSFKHGVDSEVLARDYAEFVADEGAKVAERSAAVYDEFKTFCEKNDERLGAEFGRAHEFRTSVRGLKLRGAFSTQEEAEIACKRLRERDPHHDIFVAPVGVWLPWDPDAYKTGRVEHLEPELNRLMQEKIQNEIKAKQEFDDRVKAAKRKAIEENIAKARASGNKLTQTLDETGNLVGANTIDYDAREVAVPAEQDRLLALARAEGAPASKKDA